jgi:hypothetical protein
MATKTSFTVTFTKKKETPGCRVFQEEEQAGQPPKIGSLYIKKYAAPAEANRIKVTVEFE